MASRYALAGIFMLWHISRMAWAVEYQDDFAAEIAELSSAVRVELVAHEKLLAQCGPQLGRPWCDTLKGSDHANMKELRFRADKGAWLSLSIPSAKQSCSLQETSEASTRRSSTRL